MLLEATATGFGWWVLFVLLFLCVLLLLVVIGRMASRK